MPRWSSRRATTFVARFTTLRSTSKPAKVSLCLLRFSAVECNKEQRAVICGCIDLILHRLSWETSGWRLREITSGDEPFLMVQTTGFLQHGDNALAWTSHLSMHVPATHPRLVIAKDRATQRLQQNHDSCLTTCPCILCDYDSTIQQLVADDHTPKGVTRPGHSPYSSLAKGIA